MLPKKERKKRKKNSRPLSSQKTLLFWPFNYLGANWTWELMMFEEFRALSLYEVCHLCLLRSHVAIRAFLWFKSWLMNICASRWSSCEVMSCNYLCLYCSYISIFDTWPTECICIATRGKGRGSPLLYAERSCTVRGIVLHQICIVPHKFPLTLRPALSSCCCLYSFNADTTTAGVSDVFALNVVSVAKRVNVKFIQKIIVLYRKRYLEFLFWNVTKCCLLYIFCI